ncbi:5-formyltetrahydrofolate cyclo-ligase [uncultured Dokdonia sp.]|uniref:5-formyltetrahydrofolate cyclo-ligase n=1 Tax=uncultured Dokdonia sp. TaxID=575653 RepID=UPI002634BECF|nr:5-formyltetrahydrofolate cyclo-ligase [uncultured Dokdonia sp.]
MEKRKLRKKYKELRKNLSQEAIDKKSIDIANKALELDIWDYQYYHIFLPIVKQKEVDTSYILNILQGKDKHVVVSKSNFKTNTMNHYLLTDATRFVVNEYGIPEPDDGIEIDSKKIDVVFIPLLAYDIKGNRIGYGKGFYDRFLSECKKEVVKAGVSFFEPEMEEIYTDETDIPLDYCLSTTKGYIY